MGCRLYSMDRRPNKRLAVSDHVRRQVQVLLNEVSTSTLTGRLSLANNVSLLLRLGINSHWGLNTVWFSD